MPPAFAIEHGSNTSAKEKQNLKNVKFMLLGFPILETDSVLQLQAEVTQRGSHGISHKF